MYMEKGLNVPILHAVKWRVVFKTHINGPAPTQAPLSRSNRELLVNSSQTTRELVVPCANCSWRV